MRIRKNFEAEKDLLQDDSGLVILQPESLKGQWKEHLKTNRLHLELGGGKGDFCLGLSTLYPNDGIIMVERALTIAAKAYQKIMAQENISHMALVPNNADELLEWFEPGEVDAIYLNFSDPWPKKAHHKRRLTSLDRLEKYYHILSKEGILSIKTDNQLFFEDSQEYLNKSSFQPESSINLNLPQTEYEKKFRALGKAIFQGVWKK